MPNSIMYLHEGFENPGDCFSYAGVRNYLNRLGVVYEQSVNLKTTRDIPSFLSVSGPEIVVLAGAPWIWDGCVLSEKYKAAFAVLSMARESKKVAFGVGSCFLSNQVDFAIGDFVKKNGRELYIFWSQFDLIIVRDILMWKILDLIGVESHLAPCPSIVVSDWYGTIKCENSRMLLLSERLDLNFMHDYLSDKDFDFYRKRVEFEKANGAKEIGWVQGDRLGASKRSLLTICNEINAAACDRFFTARVHAALVSHGMGLRGELMVVDSRALSAHLCGIELVGVQAEVLLDGVSGIAGATSIVEDCEKLIFDKILNECNEKGGIINYLREDCVPICDVKNTTRFFRNRLQHQVALKNFKGRKVLVVGASRGCEAYAFVIESLIKNECNFEVLAIDIDEVNIDLAKHGVYGSEDFIDFDGESLFASDVLPYFTKCDDGLYEVCTEVRRRVEFKCRDLFFLDGEFDLIICNNVLIHFSDAMATKALRKLFGLLTKNGVLLVGGCSLDVLSKYTKSEKNIVSVADSVEEIWDSWKGDRQSWETDRSQYVAMPPVDKSIADWERVYSTIFYKAN
ncbi:methyltransferase domain-containing protein [Chitinibacter fontanus]|uniref:Methyltransferase domain-containing protein n=1 Tax=Chitinibacter fontanus TaxID=1737446 RepID=A0A7D5V764_9NEIS|nr:CheR family methyltransferase [Chitinibacter fontanus]QLI80131.1 methyltransferase domain-containing protein [Chitinibacter fontanus]